MINITDTEFQEKVFDFKATGLGPISYRGLIPAVVIFYAPGDYFNLMHEAVNALEPVYAGKAYIYGVDVNAFPQLALEFGIAAVPTTLLIPIGTAPTAVTGLIPSDVAFERILMRLFDGNAVKKSNLITL